MPDESIMRQSGAGIHQLGCGFLVIFDLFTHGHRFKVSITPSRIYKAFELPRVNLPEIIMLQCFMKTPQSYDWRFVSDYLPSPVSISVAGHDISIFSGS
jgi:hypothetical protein